MTLAYEIASNPSCASPMRTRSGFREHTVMVNWCHDAEYGRCLSPPKVVFLQSLGRARRPGGNVSGGCKGHRFANVVHQRWTPYCRIRRGDHPERHGAQRPRRPHEAKALLVPDGDAASWGPKPLMSLIVPACTRAWLARSG